MAKDLGYGLKEVLSAKALGCGPASKALKEKQLNDLTKRFDKLLMLRFQWLHMEQLHKHYNGNNVFNEDVKWDQTWITRLREGNFSVWSLLFLRNEHNLFLWSNVFICQYVWQCSCPFVSNNITTLGHSFPVHEEEDEYKSWKKCSDQRSRDCLLKTWIFLPRRSLVLTLIQCHVDWLVPPVHWDWCGNWLICRTALVFVSLFHPFSSLPPLAYGLSCSLNVVYPVEGEILSLLLRCFFRVTFSCCFSSSLKFD